MLIELFGEGSKSLLPLLEHGTSSVYHPGNNSYAYQLLSVAYPVTNYRYCWEPTCVSAVRNEKKKKKSKNHNDFEALLFNEKWKTFMLGVSTSNMLQRSRFLLMLPIYVFIIAYYSHGKINT